MKAYLLAAAVLALPPAAFNQAALTCEGVAKPPPTFVKVFEPNAQMYTGPECAAAETCAPFVDALQAGQVWRDGGIEYTFEDVGELRAVFRNGTWESDELKMRPAAPPACWAMQWGPV